MTAENSKTTIADILILLQNAVKHKSNDPGKANPTRFKNTSVECSETVRMALPERDFMLQ